MTFDTESYRDACQEYKERWAALDQVLYELCDKYRDHSTLRAIYAKLWIIGRTYATGIERKIESTGSQGSSLEQLAEYLFANHASIDSIFKLIEHIEEPLDQGKLRIIVSAHGQLVKALAKKLREEQVPRSFASKYMHFHCGAVPIYDSVSTAQLQAKYPWPKNYQAFTCDEADDKYFRHSLQFLWMYQDATHADPTVKVKLLDYYLLWLAENRRKK